jgi:hypothetical protein
MRIDRSRFLFLVSAIAAPIASIGPEPPSADASEANHSEADVALSTNECQNSEGDPAECALRAPGPQCESFKDTKKECPVVRSLLKPRVAERFMSCLNAKSGTQAICEFTAASTCMPQALAAACIEPWTEAPCSRAMKRCDARGKGHELNVRDCQALLSGTVKSQHQRLISSVTEFCTVRYGYWDLSMVAHGH